MNLTGTACPSTEVLIPMLKLQAGRKQCAPTGTAAKIRRSAAVRRGRRGHSRHNAGSNAASGEVIRRTTAPHFPRAGAACGPRRRLWPAPLAGKGGRHCGFASKGQGGARLISISASRANRRRTTHRRIYQQTGWTEFQVHRYCGTGVDTEELVDEALPDLPMYEWRAYQHTSLMNGRGIRST